VVEIAIPPLVPDPFPPGLEPPWTRSGHVDPYPWFLHMATERPIAYDPEAEIWHFSGYTEVQEFLRNWETWSTAKRMERIPKEDRVIRLLTSEPPLHVDLRKHFAHAYRPRRVATLEEHIREVSRTLIAQCVARGRFDLTRDLAVPLTSQLIAELIGMDPALRDAVMPPQSGPGGPPLGPVVPDGQCPVLNMGGTDPYSQRRAADFFIDLIAERRENPRDDLASDLAKIPESELEGKLEVGALIVEQLGAGQSTTTHLLGSMIHFLAEFPDQLRLIRERPELVPMAVEETMRLCGPLQARPRIAARPVKVAGGVIPEGSVGLCWMQAANLDPHHFPDPLRFDVTRNSTRHIAFGFGEHFCLGSNLARMEGRVFLQEFLASVAEFRVVTPEPVALIDDFILRGPCALEIEVVGNH
jgi:cytochrome P450